MRLIHAVALLTGLLSVSTPALATDLWNALQLALDNDPSFQADRLEYQADQRIVDQARSALRPSIDASLGRNRRHQSIDGEGSNTSGSYSTNQLSLRLNQSLFNRSNLITVRQSKEQAKLAALVLAQSRQDLLLRASERYFDVLAAIDNLTVANSEIKAIERQLDLARERFNVGLGTKTDLFESEARFKLAEADAIAARNLINNAAQALTETTGTTTLVDDIAKLADNAPILLPDPNDVEQWLETALNNNIGIRTQRRVAEIARHEIKRQSAAKYPVIDLVASGNLNDPDGAVQGSPVETETREIGVQLAVPLYTGGLISSRTQEAQFRWSAAIKDAESAVRQTERDVRSTFLDVVSSVSRVDALLEAVKAGESAVTAKEEGFSAGVNTNIDVLDAQRDLFRASRDYLQARYEHVISLLNLERAAGTLDDEDIRRVNAWLVQ